jgi:hypothetical protein
MNINEPAAWQPRFEVYIKNHWDELKNYGIKELRLLIS